MDTEEVFTSIRKDIAEGRTGDVGAKVMGIAEETDDSFTLIKCMSLLKVVEDHETMSELVKKVVSTVGDDVERRIEVAGALRGLDYPGEALDILGTLETNDSTRRMSALCLMDMDEYESALETVLGITAPVARDRIMLTEVQSALGEHTAAVETASTLLAELPGEYEVMRCYVSALILGGRDKEAVRYVRSRLKSKDANSNAVAGYVMRVTGNIKAAAGYATRAIQIDNHHIGAMETLGICLAEKGEYDKARIIAGAINETSPGNRAALNVLSYCDRA